MSGRRAARTDANHTDVVEMFRHMGCSVFSLAGVGDGCPDLLVGYLSVTHLIEIKDGDKSPSRRKLTDDEAEWHASWLGRPVNIVESPAEANELVREWHRVVQGPW